jgi:hypothetical protein
MPVRLPPRRVRRRPVPHHPGSPACGAGSARSLLSPSAAPTRPAPLLAAEVAAPFAPMAILGASRGGSARVGRALALARRRVGSRCLASGYRPRGSDGPWVPGRNAWGCARSPGCSRSTRTRGSPGVLQAPTTLPPEPTNGTGSVTPWDPAHRRGEQGGRTTGGPCARYACCACRHGRSLKRGQRLARIMIGRRRWPGVLSDRRPGLHEVLGAEFAG